MWGISGKPLNRALRRCMGWGGGPEPYFFENWPLPLTGWVFFACSDPVSDRLHRTPTPITPTYGEKTCATWVPLRPQYVDHFDQ